MQREPILKKSTRFIQAPRAAYIFKQHFEAPSIGSDATQRQACSKNCSEFIEGDLDSFYGLRRRRLMFTKQGKLELLRCYSPVMAD